jgi:hypothetical protein
MIGGRLMSPVGRLGLIASLGLALMSCGGTEPREHPQRASYPVASSASVEVQARRLLGGDGIGSVKFGQPRDGVIAELERLLGAPHETIPGICGFGRSTDWLGLNIRGHDLASAELNLSFRHSRLAGYAYYTNAEGRAPRPGAVLLATTRGLTLGDTVARARHLYGRAFVEAKVPQGTPPSAKLPRLPVGQVRTGNGTIAAGVQGFGRRDRVNAHSTVVSVSAGAEPNTPCR